jgi:hypothetical protein
MRRKKLFWVSIAVFLFVHASAIVLVNIPHLSAGLIVLPLALADGFAMWGILNWIEAHLYADGSSAA